MKVADLTLEAEQNIREALHDAGIRLDLIHAAALLSVAIDHFAGQPLQSFLEMMSDMHHAASDALLAGALCDRCRAELNDGTCEWCDEEESG